jgi:bifunctional DNA-binding transcriptional regulator/antitoxin component of YhaV-PrlF toxin-antitoxin module
MSTLTVTAKGQITLRKDLLRHLRVAPGGKLAVVKLADGRVELSAAAAGKISGVFNLLKKTGQHTLSIAQMKAIAARGWAGKR